MLYDPETQGHDAQVEHIAVDPIGGTVTLHLACYPAMQAPARVPLVVTFSAVSTVVLYADMAALSDNHTAGNVNYWDIAEGAGTSYFHLVEGYLAITSGRAPSVAAEPATRA